MPARHIITLGTRYGNLTISEYLGVIDSYTRLIVKCDCGVELNVRYSALRSGMKGCRACTQIKHGYAGLSQINTEKSKVYRIWNGMNRRCRNPNQTGYKHYGGRGISVCERWLKFENFLLDMGEPRSFDHSIERVNVNGNYEPSNCIWATLDVQARNRRNVRKIEYNGKSMTIADWAREMGLGERSIWMRLSYGWTIERALTTKSYRKRPAAPPKPVM